MFPLINELHTNRSHLKEISYPIRFYANINAIYRIRVQISREFGDSISWEAVRAEEYGVVYDTGRQSCVLNDITFS